MKVLVVSNMAPFVWGGAEQLATHLVTHLERAGHEAELMRLPFSWEPAHRIPTQMVMARMLELDNVDRVVALKFPAYLVRHPNKVLWLVHQYRQAYDLWDSGMSNLPPGDEGASLRRVIARADRAAFEECASIYTISDVVQQRLEHYMGMRSQVMRAPLNDPELFTGGPNGGYVFAGGRVNAMKRQALLVEAMAHADPKARLVVAGPPDSQADADALRATVERLDLGARVTLDLRFLSRQEYAKYVCESSAVAYVPLDEDSFGYVSMEGATAGKALITSTDSGGVLSLVRDGVTGWVAKPDPEHLGDILSQAILPHTTARLGAAARDRWLGMGISWERTVERLTS